MGIYMYICMNMWMFDIWYMYICVLYYICNVCMYVCMYVCMHACMYVM